MVEGEGFVRGGGGGGCWEEVRDLGSLEVFDFV